MLCSFAMCADLMVNLRMALSIGLVMFSLMMVDR